MPDSLLHRESIPRIEEGKASGSGLVQLFEMLAQEALEMGEDVVDMAVFYLDQGDHFKPGTYVPELHLTVRRVTEADVG